MDVKVNRAALSQEQVIVNRVREAIADHRLRAGVKLREQALSEIFGCNRAVVRRGLLILAADKVVELRHHKGAYVATPSPKEAEEIFQARRAIERTIIRNVVRFATPADLRKLRKHCNEEAAVRTAGNRHEAIKRSGDFHLILGDIGRNDVLRGFLKELVLRSSLILGLYSSKEGPVCRDDHHQGIVDAIEGREEARSIELVDSHLRSIEAGVRFEKDAEPDDLRSILG